MKKEGKCLYVLRAHKVFLYVSMIGLVVSGAFLSLNIFPHNRPFAPYIVLVVCLEMLIYSTKRIEIWTDGLIYRICFIPIRRIPWEEITQVAIIPQYIRQGKIHREGMILFVTQKCPPYRLESGPLTSFCSLHRGALLSMGISLEKVNACQEAVEKAYGTVDRFDVI